MANITLGIGTSENHPQPDTTTIMERYAHALQGCEMWDCPDNASWVALHLRELADNLDRAASQR